MTPEEAVAIINKEPDTHEMAIKFACLSHEQCKEMAVSQQLCNWSEIQRIKNEFLQWFESVRQTGNYQWSNPKGGLIIYKEFWNHITKDYPMMRLWEELTVCKICENFSCESCAKYHVDSNLFRNPDGSCNRLDEIEGMCYQFTPHKFDAKCSICEQCWEIWRILKEISEKKR